MISYSAILPFARTRPSCTDSAVAGLAGGSSNGNSSRCHKGKENVGDAHFGRETCFDELICRRESVRAWRLVLMVFSSMGCWGFIYLFSNGFLAGNRETNPRHYNYNGIAIQYWASIDSNPSILSVSHLPRNQASALSQILRLVHRSTTSCSDYSRIESLVDVL